jgi:sulfopyruvate decarboxylase subunit alpha
LIEAAALLAELGKNSVTHVVGVPDNGSHALYELLRADSRFRVIQVTREGEAFALASGLFLGGKTPVVLIQNTGFLESGDAFRGTAFNMGIPLVLIIGYRGYESMRSGMDPVDTAAALNRPLKPGTSLIIECIQQQKPGWFPEPFPKPRIHRCRPPLSIPESLFDHAGQVRVS